MLGPGIDILYPIEVLEKVIKSGGNLSVDPDPWVGLVETRAKQELVNNNNNNQEKGIEAKMGKRQKILKTFGDKLEERFGLSEVANIDLERRSNKKHSGVPLDAWPTGDRERLLSGQKPIGRPEHPNV
jgi:hypothetical protein